MRLDSMPEEMQKEVFQSTHPLRDATLLEPFIADTKEDFNPRTPYGMRHLDISSSVDVSDISIHAPLTGCDKAELCQFFH